MVSPVHNAHDETLPVIFAGPLLRRTTHQRMALWLVGKPNIQFRVRLQLQGAGTVLLDRQLRDDELVSLPIGARAWVWLLDLELDAPLPEGELIDYDIGVAAGDSLDAGSVHWQWTRHWAPHLRAPDRQCPNFVYKATIDRLFHGSCRRPHQPCRDGLARVDSELHANPAAQRPAMLLLTGDQIYADDVAGPMLHAIHCVIRKLGLYDEQLEGADVSNSQELFRHPECYYLRNQLLPESRFNEALTEKFFGGVRKPVFTTASAGNHLITFSEVMAMYLLSWSPLPWQWVEGEPPLSAPDHRERYRRELDRIAGFRQEMPRAARALACVPTYMIFDDHDVSDDWNLSALWETTANGHPFSRRIIGNALIGYMVCQAWGNEPPNIAPLMETLRTVLNPATTGDGTLINQKAQDELITHLHGFQRWSYNLPTTPPVLVLDTRTRRWRRAVGRANPSGLMDWEALTDFQHDLLGHKSVIVVSPAPMFGVKLIEVVQRVFTWFGKPLLVDAENWMAHRGAARVLLNIFRHTRTPENFVILSGDVHYSFAYDIRLRHHPEAPRIWQITSSGIKNEFPNNLLDWLDRLNRWLYSPRSPLNWLTKRRRMRIRPRLPSGRSSGERLWNGSGIGDVSFNDQGQPETIRQLGSNGEDSQFNLDDRVGWEAHLIPEGQNPEPVTREGSSG